MKESLQLACTAAALWSCLLRQAAHCHQGAESVVIAEFKRLPPVPPFKDPKKANGLQIENPEAFCHCVRRHAKQFDEYIPPPRTVAKIWLRLAERLVCIRRAMAEEIDSLDSVKSTRQLADECGHAIKLLQARLDARWAPPVFRGSANLDEYLISVLEACLERVTGEQPAQEVRSFRVPHWLIDGGEWCFKDTFLPIALLADFLQSHNIESVDTENLGKFENEPRSLGMAAVETALFLFRSMSRPSEEACRELAANLARFALQYDARLKPDPTIPFSHRLANLMTEIFSTHQQWTDGSKQWLSQLLNDLGDLPGDEDPIVPKLRGDLLPDLESLDLSQVDLSTEPVQSPDEPSIDVSFGVVGHKNAKITVYPAAVNLSFFQEEWLPLKDSSVSIFRHWSEEAFTDLCNLKTPKRLSDVWQQELIDDEEEFHDLIDNGRNDAQMRSEIRAYLEKFGINVYPQIDWDSGEVIAGPELQHYPGARESYRELSSQPVTRWQVETVTKFSSEKSSAEFEFVRPVDSRLIRLRQAAIDLPDELHENIADYCRSYENGEMVNSRSTLVEGALVIANGIASAVSRGRINKDIAEETHQALRESAQQADSPFRLLPSDWRFNSRTTYRDEPGVKAEFQFDDRTPKCDVMQVKQFAAVRDSEIVSSAFLLVSAGSMHGYTEIVEELEKMSGYEDAKPLLEALRDLPRVHANPGPHKSQQETAYEKIFRLMYPLTPSENGPPLKETEYFQKLEDWYATTVQKIGLFKVIKPVKGDHLLGKWKVNETYELPPGHRDAPSQDCVGEVLRPLLRFVDGGATKIRAVFDVE